MRLALRRCRQADLDTTPFELGQSPTPGLQVHGFHACPRNNLSTNKNVVTDPPNVLGVLRAPVRRKSTLRFRRATAETRWRHPYLCRHSALIALKRLSTGPLSSRIRDNGPMIWFVPHWSMEPFIAPNGHAARAFAACAGKRPCGPLRPAPGRGKAS